MSKLKYGEFSFPKPTARPTVSGYARGGSTSSAPKTKGQAKITKVMGEFKRGDLHSGSAKGPIVKNPKQAMAIAMSEKNAAGYKKGGEAKASVKSEKLVGMKREPEAMVKKEIALLKKAGAPTKVIKHEERELTMPDAMKKGGKTKYQEGGYEPSSDNIFREKDGKYFHNNQELSREDFNKRREAVDRRMQQLRGPDRRGMSLRDRAKASMDDLESEIKSSEQRPFKKGGKACYADGGEVSQMAKDNARVKSTKPVKPVRSPMTDRERQMMEEARGEKTDRQMRDAERQHYERERSENEADRRAMQGALTYIPRKIGEGVKSAYDYVMGKKEGGSVKRYAMGGALSQPMPNSTSTAAQPMSSSMSAAAQPMSSSMSAAAPQSAVTPAAAPMASFKKATTTTKKPTTTTKKPIKIIKNTSGLGFNKGGTIHEDVAMDKKMIKKAVHKHEAALHPGKPMTKLKKGGVPTFNRSPKY